MASFANADTFVIAAYVGSGVLLAGFLFLTTSVVGLVATADYQDSPDASPPLHFRGFMVLCIISAVVAALSLVLSVVLLLGLLLSVVDRTMSDGAGETASRRLEWYMVTRLVNGVLLVCQCIMYITTAALGYRRTW